MVMVDRSQARPDAHADGGDPLSPQTAVRLTESVARCAVEIIRARRQVTSLRRWVTPEIAENLHRRGELTRRLRGTAAARHLAPAPVVVRGVRTCVVSDTAVEASAVIHERDRARFMVMRWELLRRRWKVVLLQIG